MKKIVINLNAPIMDMLNNKAFEPVQTVGVALAQHLSFATKGNASKCMLWAIDLNKGLPIELDTVDFETFEEFCNSLEVSHMFKVQLAAHLKRAKELSEKAKK